MKKIKFISAIALTLALGACDNFDLPNPPAQSWPEPDGYFENSGIELTPVTETLNLTQANEANRFVTVATISKLVDFPEGYTLEIDMEVGDSDQFNKTATISSVIDGDNVTVNPDFLNGAIQQAITREPGTLNVPARFVAYATRENTRLRLGGIDATYCQELLSVTTLDFGMVIEDTYYFVPCNVSGVPQMAQALKMENTAGNNVSPYDNPEFAVKLEVPEDTDYYWVIAPASSMTAGTDAVVYGCSATEDGMSGKLDTAYPAGLMPINGDVLVTVNMETSSYSISYAFETLYPVSGLTTQPKNVMQLYTDDYMNYYGVTALNQKWTLYTQVDKKGVVFRLDDTLQPETSENGYEVNGFISSSSATELPAPVSKNCLYYVDVNLVKKTFDVKALETLTVIGAGNGWNLETATPLKASSNFKTWEATDVEIGAEFKINANGAWEFDFGGEQVTDINGQQVYNLSFKGGNMPAEPGTYDVKIDFSTMPYVLTLTKK